MDNVLPRVVFSGMLCATPVTVYESLDTRVPFTRQKALANGLSDEDLRGCGFQRVFAGVYLAAGRRITAPVRAMAALTICPPGSYVSHFTAAEVWELCPPPQPLTHVSVASRGVRPQRRGIQAHVAPKDAKAVQYQGLLLSSPVQTFLDMAAGVGLVDLVVVGDRLVSRGYAARDEVIWAADCWRGRGARRARRAARLIREGVDSPMETRLRLLIVLAGLPEPVVNFILRRSDGGWDIRIDLSYPGYKIMVEYDGRQHAESKRQWQRDIERREQLDAMGWRLIVVTAEDIYREPGRTLARIRDVLLERRVPGVPRDFGYEWREHFPDRTGG